MWVDRFVLRFQIMIGIQHEEEVGSIAGSRNCVFNASITKKLYLFAILIFQTIVTIFLFHGYLHQNQNRGLSQSFKNITIHSKKTPDNKFSIAKKIVVVETYPVSRSAENVRKESNQHKEVRQHIATKISTKRIRASPWRVSINVICSSRPLSLKALLSQLAAADYRAAGKFSVDLYIRIDSNRHKKTVSIAKSFVWKFGRKRLVTHSTANELHGIWASAPIAERDALIVLKDDMRVSPFFFDWAMHLLRRYGGRHGADGSAKLRDPSLLGFSLTPMRLNEISHPAVPWNASRLLPPDARLYLHAVPSASGGVFFADRWAEFLGFLKKRLEPPYYNAKEDLAPQARRGGLRAYGDPNLLLPSSRSNAWVGSLRRFLVEYCYGRSMYTMYARLPERLGLATELPLFGSHAAGSTTPFDSDEREPTPEMLRLNPQVAMLLSDRKEYRSLAGRPTPATWRLPLFDLWGRRDSRRGLAAEASRFFVNLSAHGAARYLGLVTAWRGEGNESAFAMAEAWRRAAAPAGKTRSARAAPEGRDDGWEAEERFLVYQPQFGVSNQQASFRNAAHWAACLGRTLVVPPVLVPRASDPSVSWRDGDLVPYDALFSVAGAPVPFCGRALRTLSFRAFAGRGLRPAAILQAHTAVAGDSLTDAFFDTVLGWGRVPRINLTASGLCDGLVSRRALTSFLGGSPERVMAVNAMYKCSVAETKEQAEALLLALLAPAPLVDSSRRAVLKRLASAGGGRCAGAGRLCVQLRLGDFVDLCDMGLPWVMRKKGQGQSCQPEDGAVRKEVAAWNGTCVLVLTNDEQAATKLLGNATAGKTVMLGSTLGSLLPKAGGGGKGVARWQDRALQTAAGQQLLALLTEQLVCAASSRAVLNHFSTFGESVDMLRRSEGRWSEWW